MHKSQKILILGTYPIANPQHGGQKRLDAIVKEYDEAGFTVRYSAIYHKPFYADSGKYDISLPAKYQSIINSEPFTGDIICGKAIYEDESVKTKIKNLILEFKPDIIQIEQAFPYIGLRPLLNEIDFKALLIFSSHNIEYAMKEEMLISLGYDDSFIDDKVALIKENEIKLATVADLTVAVSEADVKELKKFGARKIILARNGIYKSNPSPESVEYWKDTFQKLSVKKIVLFVGSAHPPNWIGFNDMVGLGLGFIPLDTRIVFAGSISEYAQSELKKLKYNIGATTFLKRAYFAGRLSEDRLVGLISMADVVLLPITEGGGSNLKTAEAVASGKKIVATNYAFRGFDSQAGLPNIYLADKPEQFRASIVEALGKEVITRNAEEKNIEKQVLWPICLSELTKEVAKL